MSEIFTNIFWLIVQTEVKRAVECCTRNMLEMVVTTNNRIDMESRPNNSYLGV